MNRMMQQLEKKRLFLFNPADVALLRSVRIFSTGASDAVDRFRLSERFGWVPEAYSADSEIPWRVRLKEIFFIKELRRRFLPSRARYKGSLLAYLLNSYTPLPLTLAAQSKALPGFVPCEIPSDIIAIPEGWRTGGESLSLWIAELETLEPWLAFWVQEDIVSLYYYLMQAHCAALLGNALVERGVDEVVFAEVHPMRRGYHDTASDVTSSVLKAACQERAKPILFQMPPSGKQEDLPEAYSSQYAQVEGKIVFYAHAFELDRWETALRDIIKDSKYKCVLCIYDFPSDDIKRYREKLQKKFGVPVLLSPQQGRQRRHAPGLADILISSSRNPFPHKSGLRQFFSYLAEERWFNLERLRAVWDDIFTRFPPAMVVGSTAFEAEHFLPLMAAKHLDIPTVGMPHGALSHPMPLREPDPFKATACCFPFTAGIFSQSIAGRNRRVESFSNLNLDNEYPVAASCDLLSVEHTNILIITSPTEGRNAFFPFASTRQQAVFLYGLGLVPQAQEWSSNIRVYFKRHPGWPESEVFRLAGVAETQILPIDSALSDLLERTSVMVSVNYVGAPSEQALRRSIPVITLLPSGSHLRSSPILPLANTAGLLFDSVEQCWGAIKRLLMDRSFKEEVLQKQSLWHQEQFVPKRSDLPAWLDDLAENGLSSSLKAGLRS